jgi:hypothetical protein
VTRIRRREDDDLHTRADTRRPKTTGAVSARIAKA